MSKQAFNDIIKPIVVLFAICLGVALLLGATNAVTAPIIAENRDNASLLSRKELMPDATGFEKVDYQTENEAVKSVYKEKSGLGYIITVAYSGYGGEVPTTVAIGSDGYVIGIKVDASGETAGVGSKTASPEFTDKFIDIDDASSVDALTGATYSSNAVINSVATALEVFDALKEA